MGKIHAKYLDEMGVRWDYVDNDISHKKILPKYLGIYSHIIVATPIDTHYEVYERLAAYDGLILIEKPVVIQREHLDVLKDSRVMAGLNERYNPVTNYLEEVKDGIKKMEFYRDGSGTFLDVGIHDIDIAMYVLGTSYEIIKNDESGVDAKFNGIPVTFKCRYTREQQRYAFVTFYNGIVTADFKNQTINNAPLQKCSTIKEELKSFLGGYWDIDEHMIQSVCQNYETIVYCSHRFLVECLEKL